MDLDPDVMVRQARVPEGLSMSDAPVLVSDRPSGGQSLAAGESRRSFDRHADTFAA